MIENLWKCAIKSVVATNPADVVRLALCCISRRRGCRTLTRAQWCHMTGFFEKGCSFYQTLAGRTHGSSTAMKHYSHVTSRGQTYMCVYISSIKIIHIMKRIFCLFTYLFQNGIVAIHWTCWSLLGPRWVNAHVFLHHNTAFSHQYLKENPKEAETKEQLSCCSMVSLIFLQVWLTGCLFGGSFAVDKPLTGDLCRAIFPFMHMDGHCSCFMFLVPADSQRASQI